MEDWFNGVDSKKKYKYKEAYSQYEYNNVSPDYYKKLMTYRMHTKTDEKMFVDYSNPKVKARCVIEEDDAVKVIMGPIIKRLSEIQKEINPWYGSGLNFEERSTKFENWIDNLGDYRVLCIDGSAFDSTQHKELLEICDSYLMNGLIDNHIADLSNYCNIKHLRFIVNNHVKLCVGKTKTTKIDFQFEGKVGSGQMNTSRGNTTRAALYSMFIAHKIGIQFGVDYYLEACGDDTIIFMKADHIHRFQEAAFKYVYIKDVDDTTKHGLGQVAKIIDVYRDITDAEYISCHFIECKGRISMIRKMSRFFELTPWTRKSVTCKIENKVKEVTGFLKCDEAELRTWMGDIKLLNCVANKWTEFTKNTKLEKDKYINDHQYIDRTDKRILSKEDGFTTYLYRMYGIVEDDINRIMKKIRSADQFSVITDEFVDKLHGQRKNEYISNHQERAIIKHRNKCRIITGSHKTSNTIIDHSNSGTYTDLSLREDTT